jgi:DNA-binding winged helix-turn-helix (wHTH) protein
VAADEVSPSYKSASRVRFDLFELDRSSGQLWRGGVLVDLPPQALKILVVLAARPNQLITRKEIKETLWPGESYGDFDSRLNFAVRKLREALNDNAEQPRYIRTVRNAGYIFVAPVHVERAVSSSQSSQPPKPGHPTESENTLGNTPLPEIPQTAVLAQNRRQFWRPGTSSALLVLALVAGAAGALVLRHLNPLRAALAEQPSSLASQPSSFPIVYDPRYEPYISAVTPIAPEARQRIVIKGRGFGSHVPYADTDSPYLSIRNVSAHWAAGRMIPINWDEVKLDVQSWSDGEIVVSGFSGSYGQNGWVLTAGDQLEVAVWNPQSGLGPALFRVNVAAGKNRN